MELLVSVHTWGGGGVSVPELAYLCGKQHPMVINFPPFLIEFIVDIPLTQQVPNISVTHNQGWHFGRFLVFLGPRRLYSLSGKYSPSIPFPIEPDVPGTQSTRLRPQFHTESLIGKPMA